MEEKREKILTALKEQGYRITNQRILLIDIMLSCERFVPKDIYCEAFKKNSTIGIATVYKLISALEDIGVIDRRINL